jgi:hypothetical protein
MARIMTVTTTNDRMLNMTMMRDNLSRIGRAQMFVAPAIRRSRYVTRQVCQRSMVYSGLASCAVPRTKLAATKLLAAPDERKPVYRTSLHQLYSRRVGDVQGSKSKIARQDRPIKINQPHQKASGLLYFGGARTATHEYCPPATGKALQISAKEYATHRLQRQTPTQLQIMTGGPPELIPTTREPARAVQLEFAREQISDVEPFASG